jgi:hypothetical protein
MLALDFRVWPKQMNLGTHVATNALSVPRNPAWTVRQERKEQLPQKERRKGIGSANRNDLPPISAPRRKQKSFDSSLNKAFSIVFDRPFLSPNSVLEHALELLESNTLAKVCQCLDRHIRISKSPIQQCCLGLSKKLNVTRAEITQIRWMDKSLDLHSAHFR